jgi:hypothetical protein
MEVYQMATNENAGERALAAATQVEKIGFVDFTTNLVRGVYEVIVEASIDQLKAYADFVNSVAKTLNEYQMEAVGKTDQEENETADSYIREVLEFEFDESMTESETFSLNPDQQQALKEHFSGITVTINDEEKTIEDVITVNETTNEGTITLGNLRTFVVEKLKKNAEDSYNLMVTLLKIGMQKVVVTNGQIRTKLTFHVDTADMYQKTSTNYDIRSKSWGVRGRFGRISGGYGKSRLKVSVVNEKSTAATNVTVDVVGEVNIFFRTETFPTIEG